MTWGQISSARAIVETDFSDLEVEPSLGSHFFHNLTCFGVAYFTVHEGRDEGRIDWERLLAVPPLETALGGAIRHIRLDNPLAVLVDGRGGRGVILEQEGRGE